MTTASQNGPAVISHRLTDSRRHPRYHEASRRGLPYRRSRGSRIRCRIAGGKILRTAQPTTLFIRSAAANPVGPQRSPFRTASLVHLGDGLRQRSPTSIHRNSSRIGGACRSETHTGEMPRAHSIKNRTRPCRLSGRTIQTGTAPSLCCGGRRRVISSRSWQHKTRRSFLFTQAHLTAQPVPPSGQAQPRSTAASGSWRAKQTDHLQIFRQVRLGREGRQQDRGLAGSSHGEGQRLLLRQIKDRCCRYWQRSIAASTRRTMTSRTTERHAGHRARQPVPQRDTLADRTLRGRQPQIPFRSHSSKRDRNVRSQNRLQVGCGHALMLRGTATPMHVISATSVCIGRSPDPGNRRQQYEQHSTVTAFAAGLAVSQAGAEFGHHCSWEQIQPANGPGQRQELQHWRDGTERLPGQIEDLIPDRLERRQDVKSIRLCVSTRIGDNGVPDHCSTIYAHHFSGIQV